MLKIGLIGAGGRVGGAIVKRVLQHPDLYVLAFAVVRDVNNVASDMHNICKVLSDEIDTMPHDLDVVIDFSQASNIENILATCIKRKVALVIGATGHNTEQLELIKQASSELAILRAPNTSLAVNMLRKLSGFAAKLLPDFEAEIIEMHHRDKKDAPSGTAIKIGEDIANARGLDFKQHATFARHGINDHSRQKNEIGFSVVRGGDVFGKHQVLFLANGERLILECEVTNLTVYAEGALAAAAFLAHKPAGQYDMQDVLNFV